MTKLYLTLLALLLLPGALWAQATLTGKVTGSDEPAGLPGASVQVEGTTRGASTGPDGTYTLALQEGDSVIVVSFIGYTRQRVALRGRTTVDVLLPLEVNLTEEVVIVGYGTQRKNDITGSVGSVRGDDLVKIPNNNPVQALQGKATGVQVVANSGTPGEAPKVRIRGVGTLNNNNPLYVVDGVFMDDISAINSQDIESIELLKDASAAAIFGVRGASGVILVTTKRGKDGKTVFSFSAEAGLQTIPNKIKLLNGKQFATLYNEVFPRTYNPDFVSSTDWQDLVFRKSAAVQTYQFSASGGSANGSWYFGLGYFSQDGIVPNSSYERVSARFNNTYGLTNFWKIGSNLTIAPSVQRIAAGVANTAYRANPVIKPDTSAQTALNPKGFSPVPGVGNPLADLEYSSNSYNRSFNGIGSLYSEISFPYGFKLRNNVGIDFNYNRSQVFVPQFFVSATQQSVNGVSQLTVGRDTRINALIDNILYFNRTFGDHLIDALVGFSAYSNQYDNLTGRAQNLVRDNDNLQFLNSGVVQQGGAYQGTSDNPVSLRNKLSYYGRLNYTFRRRYSLTATYRIDQSSIFPKSNRSGYFPSIAGAWTVSEENFVKDLNAISNLRLRASWGRLGNENIPNQYLNTQYSLIKTDNSNQNFVQATLGNPSTIQQGATVGTISNPNIKWETTTQYDFGLEVGVLQNRLTFDGDYYHRSTADILVPLSVPGYLGNGATQVVYNAANVLNRGFEGNLNWRDQVGKVGYRLGALGTTIYNQVISINATVQSDKYLTDTYSRTQPGQPIGSFFGYQAQGVYHSSADTAGVRSIFNPQPGDLRFADVNGDGKINADDRTFIGSPIPRFIFGFSGGVTLAGFDLSADFQGQTGNKIYNAKEESRSGVANYEARIADRWTPTNTSSDIPRATLAGPPNFNTVSTFFIQSGDYLRLRSLTLAYTVPQVFSRRYYVEKASIYLRGTNLITWTRFTGYSPDLGGNSDRSTGIDYGTYPLTSVYSVGLNASF